MEQSDSEIGLPSKTSDKLGSAFFCRFTQKKDPHKTSFGKKIIPTIAHSGLREEFKKTFLPLLIDVFELRQMIDTYKMHKNAPKLGYMGKVSKTPQEILKQLEQLQEDIEESQRWCNGVILQIAKGIGEAKEALEIIQNRPPVQEEPILKLSFIKQFIAKIRNFLCK